MSVCGWTGSAGTCIAQCIRRLRGKIRYCITAVFIVQGSAALWAIRFPSSACGRDRAILHPASSELICSIKKGPTSLRANGCWVSTAKSRGLVTVLQIQQVENNGGLVPMQVEVLIGPLISEIRQRFDDSTQLTTRRAHWHCRLTSVQCVLCLRCPRILPRVEHCAGCCKAQVFSRSSGQ